MIDFKLSRRSMESLRVLAERHIDCRTCLGRHVRKPDEVSPGELVRVTRYGTTGEGWIGRAPKAVDFLLDGRLIYGSGDQRILGRLDGSDLENLAAFGRHGEDCRRVETIAPPEGLKWGSPDGYVRLVIENKVYMHDRRSCYIMNGSRKVVAGLSTSDGSAWGIHEVSEIETREALIFTDRVLRRLSGPRLATPPQQV